MSLLPIVSRELRLASRRRTTYGMRIIIAGVACLILASVGLTFRQQTQQRFLGLALFVVVSVLAFVYTLFAGCSMTADVISEEKREGTLGLLFLTSLRGFEIVAGKMAANSLKAFYGILAFIPIAALPLLLGGVTPGEVARVAMVALNLLFFSLTAGIYASSLTRKERASVALTFLFLALTCSIPFLIFYLADAGSSSGYSYGMDIVQFSPLFDCAFAFDANYSRYSGHFFNCLVATHLYGWLFFILASLHVPRSWQDKNVNQRSVSRPIPGKPDYDAPDLKRRRALLDQNAFLWLTSRNRSSNLIFWSCLPGAMAIYLLNSFRFNNASSEWYYAPEMVMTVVVLIHFVFKVRMASEASARFGADRRSGALEMILATPISVDEILQGYWMALRGQFKRPVLALLFFDAFMCLPLVRDESRFAGFDFIVLVVFTLIMVIVDLYAIAMVAMWQSMLLPKANQASGNAIARIVMLPCAIFFPIFNWIGYHGSSVDRFIHLLVWMVISVSVSWTFARQAKQRLNTDFRVLATAAYAEPLTLLTMARRIFGSPAVQPMVLRQVDPGETR
ncbi:MAG: family transporter protein [Verrucomicrobiales bacterium]|nr:family transporter protein [Verrucomicrobiales bacterium]